MRPVISFMHLSLDGFVAGPNGEMDWICVDEEIFEHVGRRIQDGDTALYGRKTFEMMEAYWPTAGDQPNATHHDRSHSAWYQKIQKVVLSTTLDEKNYRNTRITGSNPVEKIQSIRQQTGPEILLFGSPAATHFLIQQDLIDGYWLFVNPVILGSGIPLFAGIQNKINLKLVSTRQFSCGVTELNYRVRR